MSAVDYLIVGGGLVGNWAASEPPCGERTAAGAILIGRSGPAREPQNNTTASTAMRS